MARIWRTADGRHVPDGHPDAAFLAYADGDEIPGNVLAELEGELAPKRGRKPADKQADRPADKGGLTITRRTDESVTVPEEPPRGGPGSGRDAWVAYAAARGVDVTDDMTREDIMAAVE